MQLMAVQVMPAVNAAIGRVG